VNSNLGDLQQMVMLAVARLGDQAYGAAIRSELKAVAKRSVSVPTVYVTLVRLEDQGFVESAEVPREGQSGRARRVFNLTRKGWSALEGARAAMARLWHGVARP